MEAHILAVLKAIETAFPPPEHCHHALLVTQHGSDAEGWHDRLTLSLVFENEDGSKRFHRIFFDGEGELEDPVKLVAEIRELLIRPTDDAGCSTLPPSA